jgi:hypothetical protein
VSPDSGGAGEILFVQNGFALCDSVSSCSLVLPAQSQAGDAFLVTATYDNASTQVTGLTDDAGNSYTRVIPPATWQNHPYRTEVWYGISDGGANAITLTATFSMPTDSFASLYLDEYFGANATARVDQISIITGVGPGVGIVSSGAQMTTRSHELIFGHGEESGGANALPGTDFTTRSNMFGNIEEDRFVTKIGSYDTTFDMTGADSWIALMITLQ